MATFTPRTSRYESGSISGDIVTLDWYKYVYGTRVFNIPLPNCTTYAYGRTMEIYYQNGYDLSVRSGDYNPYWWNSTGSKYGDAETWYNNSNMTWQRGSVAQVGAIACFNGSIYGRGGHVAVIEKVNSDGSVEWSESNFGGTTFEYVTNQSLVVGQVNGHVGEAFQGYIYNPLPFGPGPGPGGWVFDHTETITVSLTECSSQTSPSAPTIEQILSERGIVIDPEGEYRNPQGTINKYTYERQIRYNNKSTGTWPSNWTTKSTSDFIQTWDD